MLKVPQISKHVPSRSKMITKFGRTGFSVVTAKLNYQEIAEFVLNLRDLY